MNAFQSTRAQLILCCCFLAAASPAGAQNMIGVEMIAQPLMNTKAGTVTACGLRVMGIHDAGKDRRVFDVSLNIWNSGEAMAKLTALSGSITDTADQMKARTLYGGWFKTASQTAAPKSALIDGESAGSKLFLVDVDAAADVMSSIMDGNEIKIGLSWQKNREVIYYGKAQISDGEKRQFSSCMGDLSQEMQKKIDREKK